jgi:hypothetical protein
MVRALLVVVAPAVALAACSSVTVTSPPASGTLASPVIGAISAASKSPGTPAPTPDASRASGTASPTPAPSGDGASLDACALLTPADISTAVGHPGFHATFMPSAGWVAGQCAWNGPGSGFFLSVGTAASIKSFGDPATPDAKSMLAQFRQQAGGGVSPKNVPAVGNGAVLTAAGIAAYSGGTYLQVTNLGLTDDQLVKIMRAAVAHL